MLSVECRQVSKSFGRTQALAGLDLEVRPGEVLGFLGPNGAGKSTTIRVLLGLLHAQSGRVRVLGADPWRHAVDLHRRLAYVPGDVALWPSMSGGEAIDHLVALHGGASRARRDELIEMFALDPRKKGREYSKGNRQKVAIIAALAVEAELLILDEPTSGLDPIMERVFQQEVARRKAEGTSVLLSSHILSEVESLADRVSMIRAGQVVASGTLAELQAGSRVMIEARLAQPVGAEHFPMLEHATVEGTHLRGAVRGDRLTEALGALHTVGVQALTIEPPSLESLFLGLYDDAPRVGPSSHPLPGSAAEPGGGEEPAVGAGRGGAGPLAGHRSRGRHAAAPREAAPGAGTASVRDGDR